MVFTVYNYNLRSAASMTCLSASADIEQACIQHCQNKIGEEAAVFIGIILHLGTIIEDISFSVVWIDM